MTLVRTACSVGIAVHHDLHAANHEIHKDRRVVRSSGVSRGPRGSVGREALIKVECIGCGPCKYYIVLPHNVVDRTIEAS